MRKQHWVHGRLELSHNPTWVVGEAFLTKWPFPSSWRKSQLLAGPAQGGLAPVSILVHVASSLRWLPSRGIQEPPIPELWYVLPSCPPLNCPRWTYPRALFPPSPSLSCARSLHVSNIAGLSSATLLQSLVRLSTLAYVCYAFVLWTLNSLLVVYLQWRVLSLR